MEVIHITPSTDGYEIVTLLANKISPKNGLSLIEKDGEQFMTGGLIFSNTSNIRGILDNIPKNLHYKIMLELKITPWVRSYASEPYGDEPAIEGWI